MKFLVSNHAGVGAMYSALDELYREIEVLRHLKQCGPAERCQMVTVLHDVIEDDEEDEIALILDYSSSGSIASYDVLTRSWNINEIINTAGKHSLSDEDMLYYIYQMAQAVDFLHRNQVAHRDLKPEHFLIQQGGKRLVLSDFGNAQKFEGSDLVQDTKGTMIYWAPECIEPDRFSKDKDLGWDLEKEESPNEVGQSGFSAYLLDTWALGVCIYSLYYHTFPFACYDSFGPDAEIKIMETLQLICTSEPSFKLHPNFRGDQVLNAQGVVKDIITGLLTKTPYERWSVANCLDYSRSS